MVVQPDAPGPDVAGEGQVSMSTVAAAAQWDTTRDLILQRVAEEIGIGLCERCGQEFLLTDLVMCIEVGMNRVCEGCWEAIYDQGEWDEDEGVNPKCTEGAKEREGGSGGDESGACPAD